ncbi:MAG: hypothetical protein LUD17_04245, partial [Bacteroidales bacterium]|nr:hypothetical protein [Bacteroidales bacterium]
LSDSVWSIRNLFRFNYNSNPTLAAADLARCLSISQRGVEKALKRLRELNVLSRRGSTKNGLWEINKS